MLRSGGDPGSIHFKGYPPLVEAANLNLVEFARVLLESGAKTDVRTGGLYTPIMLSTDYLESTDMLELLRAHDADPNFMAPRKWTPLLGAARAGRLKHAELLITAGADIAHTMEGGWTPSI